MLTPKDRSIALLMQDADAHIAESYDAISIALIAAMARKFQV